MADEVKNVIVKVTVEGDVKALNAIARIETALARQQAAAARASRATGGQAKANDDNTRSMRQSAQANIQLNQQLQDFVIQAQQGTNLMVAFTQQAAQAAFVMSNTSGEAGKFAKFLAGPWGTAVFAAIAILTPFVSKLFEAEEASKKAAVGADDLTVQLTAQRLATATLNEVTDELNRISGRYTETVEEQARALITLAKGKIQVAKASLVEAEAQEQVNRELANAARISAASQPALPAGMGGDLSGVFSIREIEKYDAALEASAKKRLDMQTKLASAEGALSYLIEHGTEDSRNKAAQASERAAREAERNAERRARAEERAAERIRKAAEKEQEKWELYITTLNEGGRSVKKITDEIEKLQKAMKDPLINDEGLAVAATNIANLNRELDIALKPWMAYMYQVQDAVKETENMSTALAEIEKFLARTDISEPLRKGLEGVASTLKSKLNPELATFEKRVEALTDTYNMGGSEREGIYKKQFETMGAMESGELTEEGMEQAKKDMQEYQEQLDKLDMTLLESKGLEVFNAGLDAMVSGFEAVINGTKSFSEAVEDMAKVVVMELTKIIVKYLLLQAITAALGGTGGGNAGLIGSITKQLGFAKGGVFENGQVKKFASGGVVSSPTYFPMASGVGLMAEAGAEAIMPLQRGSNGKLGVQATAPKVIINNYAGVGVQTNMTPEGALEIELRAVDSARKAVAADIRRGGNMVSRSIESAYGVGRGRT